MLKVVKLSQNSINHWFSRYSSSWRHQFKIEKPIYYPKRSLSEEDELKVPLEEPEKPQPATDNSNEVPIKEGNYYKILQVQSNASVQEIKTAYYKLVKKYHPDAKPTPKDTETFRKITEAYQILSDENIRSEYDRYGMVLPNGHQTAKSYIEQNKKNLLSFFREHPRAINHENRLALAAGASEKPEQSEIAIKLKFHQAIQGCTEYVHLNTTIKCPRCNGATRKGNQANIEFCPKCGGTGQYRDKTPNGMEQKHCDTCDGRRYINKNSCKTCNNRGFVDKSKRVEVNVPAGTSDGDILRINHPLSNQVVAIRVNVEQSNHFRRNGNNIATDKYITISQAVLGGKCKIRGLYEEFDAIIEPGMESHTKHCFKGKGVRTKVGHTGDHVVTFKVRIPKTLTIKQRQLMLALYRTEDPIFDGK